MKRQIRSKKKKPEKILDSEKDNRERERERKPKKIWILTTQISLCGNYKVIKSFTFISSKNEDQLDASGFSQANLG